MALDGFHRIGLRSLLALRDLELDALAVFEGAKPIHLDLAVVDVDIRAFIDGNEAVALFSVEPLDRALSHRVLSPYEGVIHCRLRRGRTVPAGSLWPSLCPSFGRFGHRLDRLARFHPPATAGMIEMVVPSGVGVASPSANRTSSSLT